MEKVIACVDGAAHTASVCDCAAWVARRLDAPLEFLHVLDRHPERAQVADYSGSLGMGAQESLLQRLSAVDEERSKLAQAHGRVLLGEAVKRAEAAEVKDALGVQRHGSLVESLTDLEPQARIFVLGQHRPREAPGKRHLDHNVERVIRAVQRPVLVAAAEFAPPAGATLAFDGSATARKMVETVAGSPLLKGLPCRVVTVGDDSPQAREHLSWARVTLVAAGFDVELCVLPGEPEAALPLCLKERASDWLVMGAYGHSRIRQLIVGSTTTALLRLSGVPVLVLR